MLFRSCHDAHGIGTVHSPLAYQAILAGRTGVAEHSETGNGQDVRICGPENKNANLHGLAFCLTLFLVARGGIEPPTQGFSIFAPGSGTAPPVCRNRVRLWLSSLAWSVTDTTRRQTRSRIARRFCAAIPDFFNGYLGPAGLEMRTMDRPRTGRSTSAAQVGTRYLLDATDPTFPQPLLIP